MIHKGIESRIEDILLIIRVPKLFFLTRALPQVEGPVTVPEAPVHHVGPFTPFKNYLFCLCTFQARTAFTPISNNVARAWFLLLNFFLPPRQTVFHFHQVFGQ